MIDREFGHWLAGFLDGEGCFDIPRQRKTRRDYYYCRLSVTLRADDADTLRMCAARLGGHVYFGKRGSQPRDGKPKARWEVSKRSELRAIVELLDQCPLRSKKARDYAIWRRALDVSESGLPERHQLMAGLRTALVDARVYRGELVAA